MRFRLRRLLRWDYDYIGRGNSLRSLGFPAVYRVRAMYNGGTRYSRMRTNQAKILHINAVYEQAKAQAKKERWAVRYKKGVPKPTASTVLDEARLEYHPETHSMSFVVGGYEALKKPDFKPEGVYIGLTPRKQAKGTRWFLVCPKCSATVRAVYSVPVQGIHLLGCKTCLGLSYPSQAGHKTRGRDRDILEGRVEASERERAGALSREGARDYRLHLAYLQMARSLQQANLKLERAVNRGKKHLKKG